MLYIKAHYLFISYLEVCIFDHLLPIPPPTQPPTNTLSLVTANLIYFPISLGDFYINLAPFISLLWSLNIKCFLQMLYNPCSSVHIYSKILFVRETRAFIYSNRELKFSILVIYKSSHNVIFFKISKAYI